MMVGSGVLGVLAMPAAVALSDIPAVAIVTGALVMAVIWGPLMWWAMRSRIQALWRQGAVVEVSADARAEAERRAWVRGLVLAVFVVASTAVMLWFMTALTGEDGLWALWSGCTLGACLWMVLELRDLTRWQDEVGRDVLLRRDVPWWGQQARSGAVFVLADRNDVAGTAS